MFEVAEFSSAALLNAFHKFVFDQNLDCIHNKRDKELLDGLRNFSDGLNYRLIFWRSPLLWKLPFSKHNQEMDKVSNLLFDVSNKVFEESEFE